MMLFTIRRAGRSSGLQSAVQLLYDVVVVVLMCQVSGTSSAEWLISDIASLQVVRPYSLLLHYSILVLIVLISTTAVVRLE